MQQTRAWLGMLRYRRPQQEPRDPGCLRALRRHPPLRHGRGDGGARCVRQRTGTRRRTPHPDRGTPPPAGRRAPARHEPGARRAHHLGGPAAARLLVQLEVPQGPRTGLLRLRPGLGRRGAGRQGRRGARRSHRARRGGPQALARHEGGGGPAGEPATEANFRAAADIELEDASRCATTRSRSRSRATSSPDTLLELSEER